MRKIYFQIIVHLRFLIYLAFALTCTSIYAQNKDLIFERIGTECGLSQNQLTCVFQDSRGMLWFGKQDGLNNRFKPFEASL